MHSESIAYIYIYVHYQCNDEFRPRLKIDLDVIFQHEIFRPKMSRPASWNFGHDTNSKFNSKYTHINILDYF